jgi:hypothetical protein
MPWSWLAALGGVVLLLLVMGWRFGRKRRTDPAHISAVFAAQRPALEQAFFAAVARSGKPRGLTWAALEWLPDVVFVRERSTGDLAALVGVTVRFEAVPGGDMEGVAAVNNLRNACAVLHYHHGHWGTSGRILFNLDPDEVVVRFAAQYERLAAGR